MPNQTPIEDLAKWQQAVVRWQQEMTKRMGSVQRSARVLLAIVVLILVVLGAAGWYVSNEQSRTASALCSLRGDLEQRVRDSRTFLREHPGGIPGITPKLIRDGMNNQRRTIRALAIVKC